MPNNQTEAGDSKERISLDLVRIIAEAESPSKINEILQDPRKYYLNLFHVCHQVVHGRSLQDVKP